MPDAYKVEIVTSARKELGSLRDPLLKRIVAALSALSGEPRPRGCKKLVGSDSNYRLRVGDYRIVYQIDDSSRSVTVFRIRHRKEVYD